MASYIPLEGIFNIKSIIDNIDKGMVADPGELITICDFLRGSRKIKEFMKDKSFYAKTLSSYADSIYEYRGIEEEIEICIKGNMVDSNASKELKRIRRQIINIEEKIEERLKRFLKNIYKNFM